jgi:Ca2+-binding EF-hand superfamily protein
MTVRPGIFAGPRAGVSCAWLRAVERERKGATMLTHFQRRKLARMFDLYDANRDGYIEADDYARVGEGFATGTGLAPGSADHEKLRATYLGFWEQLRQADADQDGKITREEFIGSYERLLAMRESIAGVSRAILQLTDRDGDGKITPGEFAANLQAYGVEAAAAAEAFRHLDRDGDGFIEADELLQDVEEFFYGDDPNAPGNWLVGPL